VKNVNKRSLGTCVAMFEKTAKSSNVKEYGKQGLTTLQQGVPSCTYTATAIREWMFALTSHPVTLVKVRC